MKRHVNCCVLVAVAGMATSLYAQKATPPADRVVNPGEVTTATKPRVITPTRQVLPDGTLFEADYAKGPFFLPDKGMGLPPNDPGIIHESEPRRSPNVGGLYIPRFGEDSYSEPDQSGDWDSRALSLIQNFEGPVRGEWTPPDPDLAVNANYILAVTNDDFAVYDKCGTQLALYDINDYLGISTANKIFDPKVIYDPWNNRWVMLWHLKNDTTQESELIFVVSGNSTPPGISGSDTVWYRFNALQDGGTADASFADYFDLGYTSGYVTASGNMFRFAGGFRWGRIWVVDKAAMYAQTTASRLSWSIPTNPDGSTFETPRAAKMQSGLSLSGLTIDGYFINSRWGGGSRLTVRRVTDAFGANTLTTDDINVSAYTAPPLAVEPDGTTIDTIDARLMPAVITGDSLGVMGTDLYTSLTTTDSGGNAGSRLYRINASSLAVEHDATFWTTGQHTWFASPVMDYSGSAIFVFSRCGPSAGQFAQARYVDFNKGTWTNSSSQLHAGEALYSGSRWGDYLGGQLDWGDYYHNIATPGRPAKMWFIGMYSGADTWHTHIGAASVYSQASLDSVTPAALVQFTGPVGGPFSPASQAYTLGISGDVGLTYTVTSLPSWLNSSTALDDAYAPSENVTLSVNSAANSLASGTYNDSVIFADCYNGGNSFTRSVRLVVQAPDLDVTSVDATNGTYHPGQILPVAIQYQNIGDYATGSYTANFYASTNTTISTADTLIGSRNYASLAPGAFQNSNHFFVAPCIPVGNYYIGVIVTVTNDSSTANNSGFDATRVGIDRCPADVNLDCFVNGDDYDLFASWFEVADPNADFNNDGFVNGDDYDAFASAFENGC
ncbi:MAG: hypothetical protein IT434_14020 [Phycisphaerales bacterium]|jgi:hypothetical protein|nr:hypothetical protein [Phycisphaerales bacterium]